MNAILVCIVTKIFDMLISFDYLFINLEERNELIMEDKLDGNFGITKFKFEL